VQYTTDCRGFYRASRAPPSGLEKPAADMPIGPEITAAALTC
jgi:hypothetical protein